MLIAGVLKFDEQGRIILSAGPAIDFNGGTPIAADGGLATLADGEPDVFLGGIGYMAPGAITDNANPLIPGGGVFRNGLGQIRISFDPPAYYYAGLPLTADGHLSVSGGVPPPVDLGAYDSGFDNAFDIVE
jgi:hypothetical protein